MLKKLRNLGLLTGVMIITALMAGCSGGSDDASVETEQAISVKALVIEPVSKSLKQVFTGTLEGEKQAAIYAKIAEAVDKVYVKEGDQVRANSVIIGLDRDGASSNYIQARSVYKNAEKNYNKLKYLYEEGAISESQFDEAETSYEVAKANFESARRTVELTTPIAGTVTSIDVSEGDFVIQGQQVATVAKIEKLRMKFGVNAEDIRYFSVGDRVTVFIEGLSETRAEGKVITVARSADPVTRTFQVDVELDNTDRSLHPGMFARAEIIIESFDNILTVPHGSMVQRDGEDHIYVVNGDRVKLTRITTGTEFNGLIQVIEGLNPGDTIVTVGQDYLDDGFKIRLNEVTVPEEKETQS